MRAVCPLPIREDWTPAYLRARGDRPLAERFWEKVAIAGPNDCWEWQAARGGLGYGRFNRCNGESIATASRVAWELTYGPIPDGLVACHRCDNPPCCNPSHLFLGTRFDNNADMVAKGRQATGERNHSTKLTTEAAREIRARYAQGDIGATTLAAEYGVSRTTIRALLRGRTWKEA